MSYCLATLCGEVVQAENWPCAKGADALPDRDRETSENVRVCAVCGYLPYPISSPFRESEALSSRDSTKDTAWKTRGERLFQVCCATASIRTGKRPSRTG